MNPSHSQFGTLILPDGVEMTFCPLPTEEMTVGSARSSHNDERPPLRIRLPDGLWLSQTPVSQAQYRALIGEIPNQKEHAHPDKPAINVTWFQARAFCQALFGQLGKGIRLGGAFAGQWIEDARLPLELEREAACRVGTLTDYHLGDGEGALAVSGWYNKNAGGELHPVNPRLETPDPRHENALHLHDLHGNVWDWCLDERDENLYRRLPSPLNLQWLLAGANAAAVAAEHLKAQGKKGDAPYRAVRGGSWRNSAGFARSGYRYWGGPGWGGDDLGFRVMLSCSPSRLPPVPA